MKEQEVLRDDLETKLKVVSEDVEENKLETEQVKQGHEDTLTQLYDVEKQV